MSENNEIGIDTISEDEDTVVDEIIKSSETLDEEISKTIQDITSIALTEEEKVEMKKPATKRGGRAKKDIPTSNELDQMSPQDLEDANIDNQISDLYGELSSFLKTKTDIVEDVGIKETIPTGITPLDAILGGGFALGTLGMAIGAPGCGKTTLLLQAIAAAQRKYKNKLLSAVLDAEEAITTLRMSNLGIKFPKLKPYGDMTVEKVFKFLEGLCLFKEGRGLLADPSIVLWDSIANTLSQKEIETEDINSVIGYKGRLLSLLIPKYVSKLSKYNICLLAINQLRDKIQIGPMAQPKELAFMAQGKTFPGGNALKFNAFHIIDMRVKGVLDINKFGFEGFEAEVKCIKNKLASPNIKITLIGNFTTGFDNFWTSYVYLVDKGRLTTGAWNYMPSLPNVKFRTKDAKTLYNTNTEFKEAFDNEIEENKWREEEID